MSTENAQQPNSITSAGSAELPVSRRYYIKGLSLYEEDEGIVCNFIEFDKKENQLKRNELMRRIVSLLNGG